MRLHKERNICKRCKHPAIQTRAHIKQFFFARDKGNDQRIVTTWFNIRDHSFRNIHSNQLLENDRLSQRLNLEWLAILVNDLPVSDQLIPMDIRPNLDKTGIAINSLSYDYHIPCHSARVKHFLRRNQPLTWNSAQRRHEICRTSKMSKTAERYPIEQADRRSSIG